MSPPPGPIIVVDDDDAVRNSLKLALELEGFDMCLYRSGAEMASRDGMGH
jgi:two-component system, LuxR family, response regulator FixJ